METEKLSFGPFVLDRSRNVLLRSGEPIQIGVRGIALLACLIDGIGKPVSKDLLLQAAWGDASIEESNLSVQIAALRKALGQRRGGVEWIITVQRFGYQLVLTDETQLRPIEHEPAKSIDQGNGPRLTIAVTPFVNLSGDGGKAYISDGITEDIATELGRFREFSIASRSGVYRLSANGGSIAQLSEMLGVTYVVDGSIRMAGNRIRASARLSDAATGTQLWADRYDCSADDVFSFLDDAVAAIVTTLEGRVVADAASRVRRKPAASWSAYDCILQGRELANQHKEDEAIAFFAKALERDPQSAQAHAWYSISNTVTYFTTARASLHDIALRAANMALECDAFEASAHWAKALALTWHKSFVESENHFARAIELNPANAQIKADFANMKRYMGRLDEALEEIEALMKRDAYAPQWFMAVRAGILFDLKRYEAALQQLAAVTHSNFGIIALKAAATANSNGQIAAMQIMEGVKLDGEDPTLTRCARLFPYAKQEMISHLRAGLALAGIGEV